MVIREATYQNTADDYFTGDNDKVVPRLVLCYVVGYHPYTSRGTRSCSYPAHPLWRDLVLQIVICDVGHLTGSPRLCLIW